MRIINPLTAIVGYIRHVADVIYSALFKLSQETYQELTHAKNGLF